MRWPLHGVVLVLGVLAPGVAAAQDPGGVPENWGVRTHDGVLLRLTSGLFAGGAGSTDGGTETSMSGAGLGFGVALGVAVRPGLVLTAETAAVSGGGTRTTNLPGNVDEKVSFTHSFLGVGGSYYFQSNLYLHGAIGMMLMTFAEVTASGETVGEHSTDRGAGVSLMVGKEWWVGDDWGLGAAGQLLLGSLPDNGTDWTSASVGVLFSATYN